MRRMLIRVTASLTAVAIGIFTILLIINILLFFKLKSMFSYGTPSADNPA